MSMRSLVLVATSGVLALGLSGCFGNPVENLVEGVIENQTGVDVEVGGTGGGAAVPENWPGLPIPDGDLISSLAVDGTFVLTMMVETEDEIERVIAELITQGYAETARADTSGFKTVVVASDELTASFSWYPDEESGNFGLNYGVTPTGG